MNTEKMKEVFSEDRELSEEALEQVSGGIGIIGLTVAWCVMGAAMLGLGTTVVVHEATSRHW